MTRLEGLVRGIPPMDAADENERDYAAIQAAVKDGEAQSATEV